jgi:hypothetical protein
VTGASQVALSLDDPSFYKDNGSGSFGEYGAQDTETVPFSCDPTAGPTTTHQYTLNTVGPNSVSMTISVSKPSDP